MKYLFINYPKCSTCQRAKAWLIDHHIDFEDRHIVEQTPTASELTTWIAQSEKPVKSFFNTSGLVYKSLGLKEKLEKLSFTEQIHLLSENGMLIKRPLVIGTEVILVGFKESEWEKTLK